MKYKTHFSDKKKKPLTDSLKIILKKTSKTGTTKVKRIFELLSPRGYYFLLIISSLPFCIPIPTPLVSTPFGILIAFLGLRIAFAKYVWWPKWILERKIQNTTLHKITKKAISFGRFIEKFVHPRLKSLTSNGEARRVIGILLFLLGILLALPLPFPFTNLLNAIPILCFGIGLLNDDGFFILIGYFMTAVSFTFLTLLFFYGKKAFEALIN